MPKLGEHFAQEMINPSMYASQWFITVFSYSFPFHLALRIWDVFLFEVSNISSFPLSDAWIYCWAYWDQCTRVLKLSSKLAWLCWNIATMTWWVKYRKGNKCYFFLLLQATALRLFAGKIAIWETHTCFAQLPWGCYESRCTVTNGIFNQG